MNYFLFTTTTCPKCPEMKVFVSENIKFAGELIDNTHPQFMDLASKFGVTQAPTFVVQEGEKVLFTGSEIYEIEDFLSTL